MRIKISRLILLLSKQFCAWEEEENEMEVMLIKKKLLMYFFSEINIQYVHEDTGKKVMIKGDDLCLDVQIGR